MTPRRVMIAHIAGGVKIGIQMDELDAQLAALAVVGGIEDRMRYACTTPALYGVVTSVELASLSRIHRMAAGALQAAVNADDLAQIVAARRPRRRRPRKEKPV